MRWSPVLLVLSCTSHSELQSALRARYVEAMHAARSWLDGVKVDPAELRAHGIKGKKPTGRGATPRQGRT